MSANNLHERAEEYKKRLLALPIAGKVSGEDVEHARGDVGFVEMDPLAPYCGCDRCRIIRIKKRHAFRFSRSKCVGCGALFTSLLYTTCEECRKGNDVT